MSVLNLWATCLALGSHLLAHLQMVFRALERGTQFSRKANTDTTYCKRRVLNITNASCSETCSDFLFALFYITGVSTEGLWCFREEPAYILLQEKI